MCDLGPPCPTLMTRLLVATSSVGLADRWIAGACATRNFAYLVRGPWIMPNLIPRLICNCITFTPQLKGVYFGRQGLCHGCWCLDPYVTRPTATVVLKNENKNVIDSLPYRSNYLPSLSFETSLKCRFFFVSSKKHRILHVGANLIYIN